MSTSHCNNHTYRNSPCRIGNPVPKKRMLIKDTRITTQSIASNIPMSLQNECPGTLMLIRE